MSESYKPIPVMRSPEGERGEARLLETKEHKEGVTLYIFKDLAVAIDTTGKNYTKLPEILVGPYDNETSTGSLEKPGSTEVKIDMPYVVKCIKAVAEITRMNQVWFDPYGDDSKFKDEEKRRFRPLARLKLFQKYAGEHIQGESDGHGYVLTV